MHDLSGFWRIFGHFFCKHFLLFLHLLPYLVAFLYFCSKFANVHKKNTYLLRISNLMCNTRLTKIVQQNILHSPIVSQLLTPCPLIYRNSRRELFARMISFLLPFSRPLPNNISETSPEKCNDDDDGDDGNAADLGLSLPV